MMIKNFEERKRKKALTFLNNIGLQTAFTEFMQTGETFWFIQVFQTNPTGQEIIFNFSNCSNRIGHDVFRLLILNRESKQLHIDFGCGVRLAAAAAVQKNWILEGVFLHKDIFFCKL